MVSDRKVKRILKQYAATPLKGIEVFKMSKHAKKKYLDSLSAPCPRLSDPNFLALIQKIKEIKDVEAFSRQSTEVIQDVLLRKPLLNCSDSVQFASQNVSELEGIDAQYEMDVVEVETGLSTLEQYKQKLADEERVILREMKDKFWEEKEASDRQKRIEDAKENEKWWSDIEEEMQIAYRAFVTELRTNEVPEIIEPVCSCNNCSKKEVQFLCLKSGLKKIELCCCDEDQLVRFK